MTFIPVNEPLLNGNEARYLSECIDSGWISSEGPFVKRFEQQFSERVGRDNAVAVSSGTAALEVAVVALGLGPGDEVIMPTLTIISCAAAVLRAGAVPVLVDSDPVTWNMDVTQIESKIGPRTKAIMAVHLYGLPVHMDPLLDIAGRHGLRVVEDAAQMLGQTYRDRPCGSFGDISVFSFYPNKHVTTGEGGMIVTDDPDIAERCRALRNLSFVPEQRFVHYELGWNFRMTNLQAALGVAQLERLAEFVERKQRMGRRYQDLLEAIPGLQLPLRNTSYAENIYWVFGVVLENEVPFDAREAIVRLGVAGVGSRPFFWPMHEQPVFRKARLFEGERYPIAELLARRGFYIPSGVALSEDQIQQCVAALKGIMQ